MKKKKSNKQKKSNQPYTFSSTFYNRISYSGAVIAMLVFIIECILFGIDFFAHGANVYMGIITYTMLPVVLFFGLLLIPAGALWKRRRIKKGLVDAEPKALVIDPSKQTHRNAILVFLIGTAIWIVMTAIGSYKAFHYTESVHFCGVICHKVMSPQYTAHAKSSHARVKCVECHIGEGADWYVRSKLSGLRQVFKTVLNTYPQPIPTPVHNLRPAKETCEQCHWPGKFFTSFEFRRTYFPREESDYSNWQMRMLVNVGRDEQEDRGIHAHMYLDNEIYYAAEDERRQQITWVKSVDNNGKESIYTSPDSKYKEKAPSPEEIRQMDCMDCHNRPSHHFLPPFDLINRAIVSGKISVEIPNIKEKSIAALTEEYFSAEEAEKEIRKSLTEYYKNKHSSFYAKHQSQVEAAIEAVVDIYNNNFFPEMKARWDAYPDNIGHLISPGCFRCHSGEHQTPAGKVISKDCKVCHTIIEQGPRDALEKDVDGLSFRHPFSEKGDDFWQEMNCFDCHEGN